MLLALALAAALLALGDSLDEDSHATTLVATVVARLVSDYPTLVQNGNLVFSTFAVRPYESSTQACSIAAVGVLYGASLVRCPYWITLVLGGLGFTFGSLAAIAQHFIQVSGVLDTIARSEKPTHAPVSWVPVELALLALLVCALGVGVHSFRKAGVECRLTSR